MKKRVLKSVLSGLCITVALSLLNPIKAQAYVQYHADDLFYIDSWSGFQRSQDNLPVDAYVGPPITIGGEPDNSIIYSYGTSCMWVAVDAIDEAHGDVFEDKWHQGYPEGAMEDTFVLMMEGKLPPDCYYLMFDYGYFTEYVDYFKSLGWISPSYQLPATFYTMETEKDYDHPYVFYDYGTYETVMNYSYTHGTDCKYLAEWNVRSYRVMSTPIGTPLTSDERYGLGEYIPKFYLENNGLLDQPLPYMELLQNWIGNNEQFNAYDYYIANPALQEAFGPDPTVLYWHYYTGGKMEIQ